MRMCKKRGCAPLLGQAGSTPSSPLATHRVPPQKDNKTSAHLACRIAALQRRLADVGLDPGEQLAAEQGHVGHKGRLPKVGEHLLIRGPEADRRVQHLLRNVAKGDAKQVAILGKGDGPLYPIVQDPNGVACAQMGSSVSAQMISERSGTPFMCRASARHHLRVCARCYRRAFHVHAP